ncbi:hypothetical protein N6H05_16120 [Sphingobium sp. WTD-1]|uniref:hypothetical protein n=1 Tax=Sphingobium sp. WTD-1 TaxID=2979467 RepID=UPI0024DE18C3|nr:hypothetical protein [Sphingobium sp. WTD-1]WIA54581.1 hypothetical protein N6H05_16120 [Sphingobium sp. WTD-1]
MAKADRLERLDIRRAELEEEYRAALIAALRVTAGGRWGLFDHQQDRSARAKTAPVLAQLDELTQEIDAMRYTLGLEPFDLHPAFMAARGKPAADAVGEPKQARAWLERLGADAG